LRLRPLAFATFLVWRLRIGACGVGACGFWRSRQLPQITHSYTQLLSSLLPYPHPISCLRERREGGLHQPSPFSIAAPPRPSFPPPGTRPTCSRRKGPARVQYASKGAVPTRFTGAINTPRLHVDWRTGRTEMGRRGRGEGRCHTDLEKRGRAVLRH